MLTTSFSKLARLILLGLLVNRCFATDPEKPMRLSEVETWGDLLAQKPVVLAAMPGIRFRLGVDRTDSKRYGEIVLYCLAQGDIRQMARFKSFDILGPFSVRNRRVAELQESFEMRPIPLPAEAVLYMKASPLEWPGDGDIDVQESVPGSKDVTFHTVATARITVSTRMGTPWSPWFDSETTPNEQSQAAIASDTDPSYGLADVSNPASGLALPKWEGWIPVPIEKLPGANRPLPKAMPARPDPGVRLSLEGNLLIVKLDTETQIDWPQLKFLTRWWVNGTPFVPKIEIDTQLSEDGNGATQGTFVKEVRFRVQFHPEYLGLKKGDRVGVQVLYCPHGWASLGVMEASAQMIEPKEKLSDISRPSNRVDFIFTGDAKAMAHP